MKRFIIPAISTAIATVALIVFLWRIRLTPFLASAQGRVPDVLLRWLFTISAFFFSLVLSFLIYEVFAFRRRRGEEGDGLTIYNNPTLEIIWTAVPLIIVTVLGIYGAIGLVNIRQPPAQNELVIDVQARQWAWSFDYPVQNIRNMSEAVLPVNQPIVFRLHSSDVIHSFWITQFRIKMDAIPGITNELRLTPIQVGDYRVECAEICGTGHTYMMAPVRVLNQADFDQWVSQQQQAAQATPAAGGQDGRTIAQQAGCQNCHSLDGSPSAGPTWKGLYGSQVKLADGAEATANDEYLYRSIIDPSAQIVQGFPDIMPKDFGGKLSDEQIKAIIDFIKTLK